MADENFQLLKDILSELENQHLKRTHSNILDKLLYHQIDNEAADTMLDTAVKANILHMYRYSKQINYRLKTEQTATITDPVVDVSTLTTDAVTNTETTKDAETETDAGTATDAETNTLAEPETNKLTPTYATTEDLSQLKDDLLKEICAIAPRQPETTQAQIQMPITASANTNDAVVAALLKHIDFLQNTITNLISNSKAVPPNPPTALHPPLTQPAAKPTQLKTNSCAIPPVTPVAVPTSAKPSANPATNLPTNPPANPSANLSPSAQKYSKKQVLIVGDSMLNCIDEQDLREDAFVRVRNHPGATVEDLLDHTRAHTRTIKHDAVIIMAGTNDISANNMKENKDKPKSDIVTHMHYLIKQLKASTSPNAHIAICQITARKDKPNIMKDVSELNHQLRQVAQREQIGFVNTSHFLPRHTGKKGVHPNDDGLEIIYSTLEKYVRKVSHL